MYVNTDNWCVGHRWILRERSDNRKIQVCCENFLTSGFKWFLIIGPVQHTCLMCMASIGMKAFN